jgi:uncharacterized iron-regulated membrane protein
MPVDLVLEQVDRAGDRQEDQERQAEEAGVEVPAPDPERLVFIAAEAVPDAAPKTYASPDAPDRAAVVTTEPVIDRRIRNGRQRRPA